MVRSYYELMKDWTRKNTVQSSFEKFKISIISIVLGVLAGMVVLLIMKQNPLDFFQSIFKGAFIDQTHINTLLIFTSIFTLAGLANAFAFKTGLFNIGVSGQMMAGGGVAILLALTTFNGMDPAMAIPLLFVVAIVVSGLVGLLVGILKAYLNVHEVVSTILLNWIIFYFMKFLFRTGQTFVKGDGNSSLVPRAMRFGGTGDQTFVIMLVVTLIVAALFFVIVKFTAFGQKIKITGMNKDASEYAGINVKASTIWSLVISAGIAGILGFVYYMGYKHFFPQLQNTLPSYGYDGIAVALLAFSSPIAVPFIGFFYAIFVTGAPLSSLDSSIQNEMVELIFSIIIYFAAASSLFIRFKPVSFVRWLIIINKDEKVRKLRHQRKAELEKVKASDDDAKTRRNKIKEIKGEFRYLITTEVSGYISNRILINKTSTWYFVKQEIVREYSNRKNVIKIEAIKKINVAKSESKDKSEFEKVKKQINDKKDSSLKHLNEKLKEVLVTSKEKFTDLEKQKSTRTFDEKLVFAKLIEKEIVRKGVK